MRRLFKYTTFFHNPFSSPGGHQYQFIMSAVDEPATYRTRLTFSSFCYFISLNQDFLVYNMGAIGLLEDKLENVYKTLSKK